MRGRPKSLRAAIVPGLSFAIGPAAREYALPTLVFFLWGGDVKQPRTFRLFSRRSCLRLGGLSCWIGGHILTWSLVDLSYMNTYPLFNHEMETQK